MRKYLLTLVAAAGIAAATLMQPGRAEARCIGCWVGAGIAVGLLAGAAFSYPAYGYGYAPYGYGYYRPAYYGGPYYAYGPRYYGYYGPRYYGARYGYYGAGYGYYGPRYYGRPYRYYW